MLEQPFEVAVEYAPSNEGVWIPLGVAPGVAVATEFTAGFAHLINRTMRKQLWDVVVVEPCLEVGQWRPLRMGLEQVVVLETLENDEPVPVLPDEIRVITPPSALLESVEHIGDLLQLSAWGGGSDVCCHNCSFLAFNNMASACR